MLGRHRLHVLAAVALAVLTSALLTAVALAIGTPVAGSGSTAAGSGSTPAGSGSTAAGSGSTPAGSGSTPAGSGSTPAGSGSTPAGSGSTAAAPTAATGTPSSPTVTADKGCYINLNAARGATMTLTAAGWPAADAVTITGGTVSAQATVGAGGAFTVKIPAPTLGTTDPGSRRTTLTITARPAGATGTPVSAGTTGTSVRAGATGTPVRAGATGTTGTAGSTGTTRTAGSTGTTRTMRTAGSTGTARTTRTAGSTGSTGTTGTTGTTGKTISRRIVVFSANLAVLTRPLSVVNLRRDAVTFVFSGFTPGKPIYGYYLRKAVVAKMAFHRAAGPCGTLQQKALLFPGGRPKATHYDVAFESTSRYSKHATPRVTGTLDILPLSSDVR